MSSHSDAPHHAENNERDQEKGDGIALPVHVAGSGALDRLVVTARDYAKAATAENTIKAYAADWKHFRGVVTLTQRVCTMACLS